MGRAVKRWGESGQALIEYIAIVTISVLVIIGLVYKFNDAFRQYAQASFGSEGYLYCLIQNGLLPGESDICSPPSFDLNKGKMLSANGIGGTGAAGAGGNGNGGRGVGGAGGLRASEFSGGLIPYNPTGGLAGKGGAGPAGAGKDGAESAKRSTGNDGFSSPGGLFGGKDSGGDGLAQGDRSQTIPINDNLGSGGVKKESIPVTERDLKSPRLIAAEKKRKQEELQDVNGDFSFGKILKYIIILIICFSIFFFVGSQLLAISRGNKKRN